jgi:NAD(P)-dependent dehydrogenase (short-subunit alcohol dehydrogenase family)
VYGPKGAIEDVDWAEWVQALNVNLLGTILCCRSVLPHFRVQRRGKIVLLSGGGATKPMPFLSAYAASKAAVVRFGETLAGEVRGAGIDVNSVAPGASIRSPTSRRPAGGCRRRLLRASLEQTDGARRSKSAPGCAFSRRSRRRHRRVGCSAPWDP